MPTLFWIWLVAAVIFLIIELATPSLVFASFIAGAICSAVYTVFYPESYVIQIGIFAAVSIILLPFMFFYLAYKSLGTLQKSFFLNALGLLIYYIARALQPVIPSLVANPGESWIQALVPPLLILLSILLLTFANQYEHLK